MKTKIIVFILLISTVSVGSYYYYRYNYVQTLMLSEIAGKTDNALANIAVSLFDFDTGLTRNDLHNLKSKKDYWIDRMNKIEVIVDPISKQKEYEKFISEMLEDPTMSKILKGTLSKTSEFLGQILKML